MPSKRFILSYTMADADRRHRLAHIQALLARGDVDVDVSFAAKAGQRIDRERRLATARSVFDELAAHPNARVTQAVTEGSLKSQAVVFRLRANPVAAPKPPSTSPARPAARAPRAAPPSPAPSTTSEPCALCGRTGHDWLACPA